MVRSFVVHGLAFLLVVGLCFSTGSRRADADAIGAWLFDEGEGDTAKDSSGNGGYSARRCNSLRINTWIFRPRCLKN